MQKLSKQPLRYSAWGIGLCVVFLFILSEQLPHADKLNNVSKLVEWTGMVFLPLFGLNLVIYDRRSARLAALGMIVVHIALMELVFQALSA